MTMTTTHERGFYARCWCGGRRGWHSTADLNQSCADTGMLQCACGGDMCCHHNHGEAECFGCANCEGDQGDWPEEEEHDHD